MNQFRNHPFLAGLFCRSNRLNRLSRLSPFGLLLAGCLLSPDGSTAQAVHYAGKVLDQDGKALASATVSLEGSTASVQSGVDGAFDLGGTVALRSTAPSLAAAGLFADPFTDPFADASSLVLRADGRALARGPRAQGAFLALREDGRGALRLGPQEPAAWQVTPVSPLAKPGAAPSGSAGAAIGAAGAAYRLAVSKAGYYNRRFTQNNATALSLTLSLLKRVDTTGGFQAEKKLCMDEANRYRATLGLAPVAWSSTLEAYADEGARYDAARNQAHAHFGAVRPLPADAENEIPGWPLLNYKTVSAVVEGGIKMMWDEGPGGGHYENIKGSHTVIGCGIHITDYGDVWIVQDLK